MSNRRSLALPLLALASLLGCVGPGAGDELSDTGETAPSCDAANPDGSGVAEPQLLTRLAVFSWQ